jgi:hypothetical protein
VLHTVRRIVATNKPFPASSASELIDQAGG